MKIGDAVWIRGIVDEIRKDTVIIKNKGGYFGTDPCEVVGVPDRNVGDILIKCKDCKYWRSDHTCREHSLVSPMGANEFCSRGERGEADDD